MTAIEPLPVLSLFEVQHHPASRSISDDDLCGSCQHLLFCPGLSSLCRLQSNNQFPGSSDENGYVQSCPHHKPVARAGDNFCALPSGKLAETNGLGLRPWGNFPPQWSFSDRVRTLFRPYMPLDEEEYAYYDTHESQADIFADASGNLFTFGDADGGKALMPVEASFKSKLHPIT